MARRRATRAGSGDMSVLLQQQTRRRTVVAPPSGTGLQSLVVGDLGCDVSSYQPVINWPEYAASGRKWAFIKATEGTNYVNPYFAGGWSNAKAVNVLRGTYHFARPDQNSPDAEVNWFLRNVNMEPDDMLALDIEDGSGDLFNWTMRFLQLIEQQAGRKALLYSGLWFMQPHNLCHAEIRDASLGLWYASYQGAAPPPPPGWGKIVFWQHTSKASVPGIPGEVDESVFLGW